MEGDFLKGVDSLLGADRKGVSFFYIFKA